MGRETDYEREARKLREDRKQFEAEKARYRNIRNFPKEFWFSYFIIFL